MEWSGQKTVSLKPHGLLGWAVAVAGIGLVICLAVFFFTVALVLVGASLIVAPFLGWRARRRLRRSGPRVIEVEYTITSGPKPE